MKIPSGVGSGGRTRRPVAFGLGWLVMIIMWSGKMVFKSYDPSWLKGLGGYFGERGKLPAGTFNAGQKIFFWLILGCGSALVVTGGFMALLRSNPQINLAVLYTVHDLTALLLLLLVVAHAYFGIILNPHSLRSIFGGMVSRRWLVDHHPNALERTE
jgi:formate dehydrogenase subunit gamma